MPWTGDKTEMFRDAYAFARERGKVADPNDALVTAVDLTRKVVCYGDGLEAPITHMFDLDGKGTLVPWRVRSCVAGPMPSGEWIATVVTPADVRAWRAINPRRREDWALLSEVGESR